MNLADLLPKVVAVAQEAGQFIREARSKFQWESVQYKGNNDLVSYVDRETEQLVVARLQQLLPVAGFITEEGTVESQQKPWQWVIDPLDGTTNFVHDIPMYAVSIGLLYQGVSVLGVVYEVTRDECFYAATGHGAFCNGTPIKVSPLQYLNQSVLATGYPQINFDRLSPYLQVLGDLMQVTHGIRRMGSAAVDLAYVACGRVSAFFEYNLNIYDVAAGVVLVQEAGGQVTDFKGGEDYLWGRTILAANQVHTSLLEVIQKHWVLV